MYQIKKEYDDLTKDVSIFSDKHNRRVNVPFQYKKEKYLKRMTNSFFFSKIYPVMFFCFFVIPFGVFYYMEKNIWISLSLIFSIPLIGIISNKIVSNKWKKKEEYNEYDVRDHNKEYIMAQKILIKYGS